jgi:glyoxylate reductase
VNGGGLLPPFAFFTRGQPELDHRQKVTVARKLLPAGEDLLSDRFDLVCGGLDADREILVDLIKGSAALVADPTVAVDREVLDAAGAGLELVANFAVGYDNVDLDACRDRGVVVTNTPDVLTDATAELAAGLTLAAARQIPDSERSLREGRWSGWDPAGYRGTELSGTTFGIVGLGRIGQRYAELMRGFAGEMLYVSRTPKPETEQALGVIRVGLDELLERSDVVSLHIPGGPASHHLIDSRALGLMKDSAVLVNTARGPLVDSAAVARALRDGRLGAVGLDVFEGEPTVPAELLGAPRAVLTPHIGSATHRARDEMARLAARNVIAVLDGREPLTPVPGS